MWLVIPDEYVGLFPKAWGGKASVLRMQCKQKLDNSAVGLIMELPLAVQALFIFCPLPIPACSIKILLLREVTVVWGFLTFPESRLEWLKHSPVPAETTPIQSAT